MKFRTVITSGKEVLFVGHERGNAKSSEAWLSPGRWKISISALDAYLSEKLETKSFGSSVGRFVFCFEIADFENWGKFFGTSATYTSYRPKSKEVWSVGQVRWSEVKDLEISDQILALRGAIQAAIKRVGARPRKPKDFAFVD